MSVKNLLLGSIVFGGVCAAGAGTVVYQNDFSARRSVVKPQPGPWRTYEYTVDARLAHNYSSPNYGSIFYENMPWSDPSQQQDGWVLGGSGENNFPGAWVRTNSVDECSGDTTHRFGTFEFNANDHTWNRVLQPIGNSFSNGVVRYTVDMRPPKWWGAAHGGEWVPLFRFYPAFRRDLRKPDFGSATEENPCAIGFTRQSIGTGTPDNVLVEGAQKCFRTGTTPFFCSDTWVTPGNWYRCFVELDIDNQTVDTKMYDMGGRVPDFDTTLGELVLHQDGPEAWRWSIDETRGPIDGIAFQTEGINSFGVVTNMPCFTNIKVEWKAPGTEEFLCCYENDFTTCRKRTLVPMTESHDYPEITTAEGTTTSASYRVAMAADDFPDKASSAALMPMQENNGKELQPVGFDNWRRISEKNWAAATIADYDGDKKFRVTWPWGYNDTSEEVIGLFTQPLGEPITSGKVRLLCDIRTPSRFWYTDNSGLYVMLGDRNHYTSFGNVGSAVTYAAFAGIGQDGQGHCYPEMKTGGGWVSASSSGCDFLHWYRVELVADVENKTYTYRLYDIEGATPDVPIYKNLDMAFAAQQAESNVAAFTLSSYGAGVEPGDEHLYDNVVVWKNWDETTGTGEEIYRNDFSTRTRYSARVSERLGDAPNLTTAEKDYWTVRGGNADGVLRALGDNDNPCACFFTTDKNPYVMQDFGTVVRSGKLTFTADMRPPNVWHKTDFGREASVYVGGGKMAQGNLGYGRSIYTSAAMCFGFDGGGAAWDAIGLSRFVSPYVMNGSETRYFDPKFVDATHWYRFVSKFDIKAKKVDVAIYDMGESHPEPNTPLGNKIAEATGLDFVDSTVEELSTVCLHAVAGRQNKPWQREDEGCTFIDNLKAYESSGFSIIIR